MPDKVIIVEGLSDKKQIEKVLTDYVTIICTHGTFSVERFDVLLETYDLDHKEVYIFVDEDKAGTKLRNQLTQELPHAKHIYVNETFREVATTPVQELAFALFEKHLAVDPIYLQR